MPYPAGGGLDVFARQLAQKLSERMGTPFVIENRPGAGTVIGAAHVAKSAPDGYTIMLGTSSAFAINVTLNKSLPYDPAKHFAPIIYTSDAPFLLLVHSDVPVKTVGEWIKWVNAQPKPPSYGTAGPGSPQHLSMELLKTLTGTKLVHVPYRGDAPALNDLVAGHIPTLFAQPTPVLPLMEAGKIRALGISSPKRFGPMATIPTIAEAGVPGLRLLVMADDRRARRHAEADRRPAPPRAEGDPGDAGDEEGLRGNRPHRGRQPAAGGIARVHPQRDRAAGQGGGNGGDRTVAVSASDHEDTRNGALKTP